MMYFGKEQAFTEATEGTTAFESLAACCCQAADAGMTSQSSACATHLETMSYVIQVRRSSDTRPQQHHRGAL